MPGKTPLVGWLKAYMVPELLSIPVSIKYTLYTVRSLYNIHYTLSGLYTVYIIHCSVIIQYTLYKVLSLYSTPYTLYTFYSILRGFENKFTLKRQILYGKRCILDLWWTDSFLHIYIKGTSDVFCVDTVYIAPILDLWWTNGAAPPWLCWDEGVFKENLRQGWKVSSTSWENQNGIFFQNSDCKI